MSLLMIFGTLGVWIYVSWMIGRKFKRDDDQTMPKLPSNSPPDASEPKRRISYRPPKK